jgi:hypothetical protein
MNRMMRRDEARRVLTCTCEKTMALDGKAIAAGCGGTPAQADQLCRAELQFFHEALAGGIPITVGCTQEQPLF